MFAGNRRGQFETASREFQTTVFPHSQSRVDAAFKTSAGTVSEMAIDSPRFCRKKFCVPGERVVYPNARCGRPPVVVA
ncbi:MAG TPA: hypothetical protein DDZ51_29795 [Planctomycetaceae bacterium]|nr:hypothetical protein [Planctomycetaceae bacterium]